MAAIPIVDADDSGNTLSQDDEQNSTTPDGATSSEIEANPESDKATSDAPPSLPQSETELDDECVAKPSDASAQARIGEEGMDDLDRDGDREGLDAAAEDEEERMIRMAMEASLKDVGLQSGAHDRIDEDHEQSSATMLNDEIASAIEEEPLRDSNDDTRSRRSSTDGNSTDYTSDDAPGIPQLGAFFAAEREKDVGAKQTTSDGSYSITDGTISNSDDKFNNSMGSALTADVTASGSQVPRHDRSDSMSLPDEGVAASRTTQQRRISSRVMSDVASLPDSAPNDSPSLCDYTPRGTRLRRVRPILTDTASMPGDSALRDDTPRGTPLQRARTADYSDDRSVRSSGSYYKDDSQRRSRRRALQKQYNSTRSLQRRTSLRDLNSRSTADSASVSSGSRRRDINSHKSDSSSSRGGTRSLPAGINQRDRDYTRRAQREIERTETIVDNPNLDVEHRRRRLSSSFERSDAIIDSPHADAEERRRRMGKVGQMRVPIPYSTQQGSSRSLLQNSSLHSSGQMSHLTQSPGTASVRSETDMSRSDQLESARAHLSAQELMEIEKALREADELETNGNGQLGDGYLQSHALVPATPSTRSRSSQASTPVSTSSHGLPLSQSSQSSRSLPIRVPRPPANSGRPPVQSSSPIRQRPSPKNQSTPDSPHSTAGNSPHPSPPSIMFPPYSNTSGSPVPTKSTLSSSSLPTQPEKDPAHPALSVTPASPAQRVGRRTLGEADEEEANRLSMEEAQAIELALKEADQKAEEESLLLAFQMQQEELQRTLLEQQQQQHQQQQLPTHSIPAAEPVTRSPVAGRRPNVVTTRSMSARVEYDSHQNPPPARAMSARAEYANNQHRFNRSLRVEDLDDGRDRQGRHEQSSKSYDDELESSHGAFQSSEPAPRHPLENQIGAFQSSEPARRHPLEDESTISTLTHTHMGNSDSSLPTSVQVSSPRNRRRGAGFAASLSRVLPSMRRRGSDGNRRTGVLGSRGRSRRDNSDQSSRQQAQRDNEESLNTLEDDDLTPVTQASTTTGARNRLWNRRDRNNPSSQNSESRNQGRNKQGGGSLGHASLSSAHQFATECDSYAAHTQMSHQSFSSFRQMKQEASDVAESYGAGRSLPEPDSKGKAMDPHVRLQISRAINGGLIERCNGAVKQGKEAVIYHAVKGSNGGSGGYDVAVKVFKRNQEYRGRGDYVDGDPRFAGRPYYSASPREQVDIWCEKEYRNLVRASRALVPVPPALHYKENVIFMRFMGNNGWPAPQLREIDARKGHQLWDTLYTQVMEAVRRLYAGAKLVHGDLSEQNILVAPAFQCDNVINSVEDSSQDLQAVLIDFAQAVDKRHPDARSLLHRDLSRMRSFFQAQGVKTLSVEESMEFVVDDFDNQSAQNDHVVGRFNESSNTLNADVNYADQVPY